MNAVVILNPYAGRWTTKKRIPEVQAALKAAGIEFQMQITEGPRHAIQLAAAAVASGCDAVISAGGDGTIGEVVNGMCQASFTDGDERVRVPLGVLPLGSANDFVVNLKLPKTLEGAAAALPASKVRWIDLGKVSYMDGAAQSAPGFAYFDNNSAMGLEPSISLIQEKITWLHGSPRYLLATLIGVIRNPHWTVQLEWDGGSYNGPVSLVTVGNNPLTGGLFYMTPHADPADGLLTFVYGYMRTRPQVLSLLPRTMKPGAGSYVEHPAIHEVHSTWLRMRVEEPTPLHADGEIQSRQAQIIEYQVLPGRLPILVPSA